ncbi:hypothetical protein [Bauldia litoralis]|uniref:Bacteriophage-related protein n=1 Tax=Bauldia litoralis TaxID=665467 RepID=A0A1G6EQ87_9HYPH|nr:hypothetical protein [Bauldia litoralis]SDB59587.1 hypothetical protein SAMN02982931_04813 [Bauldia litoralis]
MIETVVVPRSSSPSEPVCDAGTPTDRSADPTTITVHVPLTFKRRGGRKSCVTRDGTPAMPLAPRPDSVLVKALARAYRWQRLLESGTHATIQDLAAAERMNPSYVGRILRLNLLAPDIVEAILDGRTPPGLTAEVLVKSLPSAWGEQRRRLLPHQSLAASEAHARF